MNGFTERFVDQPYHADARRSAESLKCWSEQEAGEVIVEGRLMSHSTDSFTDPPEGRFNTSLQAAAWRALSQQDDARARTRAHPTADRIC